MIVITKINTSVFSLSRAYFTIRKTHSFYLGHRRRHCGCAFINNEVQSPSRCAARARNNDERVAQGNDRRIPSQDVSRFRNSFAGRNKFLKDPTSARSATAGRKIPAVTLRDLDVVGIHDCTFWKFGPGGSRAG